MPFDPYFSSAPDPAVEERHRKVALAKAFQAKYRLSLIATNSKKIRAKALRNLAETPQEYMIGVNFSMLHHKRRAHRQLLLNGSNSPKHFNGFPSPRKVWD